MLLGSRHWVAVRCSPLVAVAIARGGCGAGVFVKRRRAHRPRTRATARRSRAASRPSRRASGDRALELPAAEKTNPGDCRAAYCDLIARTMHVLDQINGFLLPRLPPPSHDDAGRRQGSRDHQHPARCAEQSAETRREGRAARSPTFP